MPKYYIIELTEDVDSNINDRVYYKNHRYMVWEDSTCYRVVNNDMDFIPFEIAKKIGYATLTVE